jgi:hypothetical protein
MALSFWRFLCYFYISQDSQIPLHAEGIELEAKTIARIDKVL